MKVVVHALLLAVGVPAAAAPPADSLALMLDRYLVELDWGLALELPEGVTPVEVYPWGEFGLGWRGDFLVQGHLLEGDVEAAPGAVPQAVLREARSRCVGEAPAVDVTCRLDGEPATIPSLDFWDPVVAFRMDQRVEEPGAEALRRPMGPFYWIPIPPGREGGRGLLLHPAWGELLDDEGLEVVRELMGGITPPVPTGIDAGLPALSLGDAPVHATPGDPEPLRRLSRGSRVEVVGPGLVQRGGGEGVTWQRVEHEGGVGWVSEERLALLEESTPDAAVFRGSPGGAEHPVVYAWASFGDLIWIEPEPHEEVLFSASLLYWVVLDHRSDSLRVVDALTDEILLEAGFQGTPAWERAPDGEDILRYRAVVGRTPEGDVVTEERTFHTEGS